MSVLDEATGSALTGALATHCAALMRTPCRSMAIEQAQRRLQLAAERAARPRVRSSTAWFGAMAAAACAVVVLIVAPLLTGGGEVQGASFDAVQRQMRDFRTLDMRIEQRFDGELLVTSRVRLDRGGATRTDVGSELSVIVDVARGRIVTLLHDSHEAQITSFAGGGRQDQDALGWLHEIETFKGVARRLPNTRRIDGQDAQGWSFDAGGSSVVMWADAQGFPREMTVGGSAQLDLRFRFTFDAAFAADVLSSAVPAGYRVIEDDAS